MGEALVIEGSEEWVRDQDRRQREETEKLRRPKGRPVEGVSLVKKAPVAPEESAQRPTMNFERATILFERLIERGYTGAFDCSMACVDGYFRRGRRAGQPRTHLHMVKFTPTSPELYRAALEALGPPENRADVYDGNTYTVFVWDPEKV